MSQPKSPEKRVEELLRKNDALTRKNEILELRLATLTEVEFLARTHLRDKYAQVATLAAYSLQLGNSFWAKAKDWSTEKIIAELAKRRRNDPQHQPS